MKFGSKGNPSPKTRTLLPFGRRVFSFCMNGICEAYSRFKIIWLRVSSWVFFMRGSFSG
jgi:hypothetical protein